MQASEQIHNGGTKQPAPSTEVPPIQQAACGTQALLKHSLDVAQVPYAAHTQELLWLLLLVQCGPSVYLGIAAGQTSSNHLLSFAGKLAGV